MGEEVVEKEFEPRFLRRFGLAHVGRPERVGFGKTGLEHVAWIGDLNEGLAAATVRRVNADEPAEKLGVKVRRRLF